MIGYLNKPRRLLLWCFVFFVYGQVLFSVKLLRKNLIEPFRNFCRVAGSCNQKVFPEPEYHLLALICAENYYCSYCLWRKSRDVPVANEYRDCGHTSIVIHNARRSMIAPQWKKAWVSHQALCVFKRQLADCYARDAPRPWPTSLGLDMSRC